MAAIAQVRRVLSGCGYREVSSEREADRCLVMGPPGRWLHLGDSAASTDFADAEAFHAFSLALSTHIPLVDIQMSDDACLHLTLFRESRIADRFGTGSFPFCPSENPAQELEFPGNPADWQTLLLPGVSPDRLRDVWESKSHHAWSLLDEVAALVGWHPELVRVGYTHDVEGLPERYDAYLEGSEIDLAGFQELYFRLEANASRGSPAIFADMEWGS